MLLVGLTGSIGMGKSATAHLFEKAGVPVHDSDAAVHRLYRGVAAPLIDAAFPGTAATGAVDRAALADVVIDDSAALAKLEAIVHPLVAADRASFIDRSMRAGRKIIVLDIPLLFETRFDTKVDVVVVAHAESSVQKSRVLSRPGMTAQKFEAILAKQIPAAEKRRRAHYVIETDRGPAFADRQIHAVLRALAARSAS